MTTAELQQLLAQSQAMLEKINREREVVIRQLQSYKAQLAESQFGVKVGSIVSAKRNGLVGLYRVVEVDSRYGSKPWIIASPLKKDGTYGTARRSLYTEWTLVDA